MAHVTLTWEETPPAECRAGALTIGNFDGVHRGHAALLAELRRQAQAVGGPAVVLTFDPHPLQLLRPDRFLPVLTTMADRAALLHTHGADHVVCLQTTPDLLQQSADAFFNRVMLRSFQAGAVVEGPNFGFGRNREGTVATLQSLCARAGIKVRIVEPTVEGGIIVSSNRVRTALMTGTVREAADLLGRPYRLCGVVGVGQRRGQTLGFPTANLEKVATLIPGDGVYAVRVLDSRFPEKHENRDWKSWPGAVNIGPNPTFGEQVRKVEVHLIGYQGDLYGQTLAVDFIDRLRDTRPFANVGELVAQLHRDVELARHIIIGAGIANR